jgi:uncharacterized membrane protein YeaQ/YmgE (transglycosylase-associated protein family)
MNLVHLLVFLVVGAVVGLMAERLTDRKLPYAWVGASVAGLVGAWLLTDALHIEIAPQASVVGIPLLSALLGATIAVSLFSLVTSDRFGFLRAPARTY